MEYATDNLTPDNIQSIHNSDRGTDHLKEKTMTSPHYIPSANQNTRQTAQAPRQDYLGYGDSSGQSYVTYRPSYAPSAQSEKKAAKKSRRKFRYKRDKFNALFIAIGVLIILAA